MPKKRKSKLPKRQKRVAMLGLSIAVVALVVGYRFLSPAPPPMDMQDMNQKGTHEEAVTFSQVHLSPRARALAQVVVIPVERRQVEAEVRLFGRIDYDETKLAHITAWVPSRIEHMYINFTGITIAKGDHMVEIYSPELLVAQEELLRSLRTLEGREGSPSIYLKEQAKKNLESARSKLLLWGIEEGQIQRIEESDKVETTLTINAPMSGVVISKDVVEGRYVQTGTRIYTIADLEEVWLELDAYESDLTWLRYAQEASFTTDTYPGEVFHGKISFIDPFLNEKSRTAMVRINVPNADGQLKPGMYARAIVRPVLSADGSVQAPDLEGKWISPMHPRIVRDEPGTCPICGMELVDAESLGYIPKEKEKEEKFPLVIPTTAPLITGKRAIVYVQLPDKDGVYEARAVTLGPRTKDSYIVKAGVEEGELVVVNGNFKIDSAAQILAKPSMMSPEGGDKPTKGHQHGG